MVKPIYLRMHVFNIAFYWFLIDAPAIHLHVARKQHQRQSSSLQTKGILSILQWPWSREARHIKCLGRLVKIYEIIKPISFEHWMPIRYSNSLPRVKESSTGGFRSCLPWSICARRSEATQSQVCTPQRGVTPDVPHFHKFPEAWRAQKPSATYSEQQISPPHLDMGEMTFKSRLESLQVIQVMVHLKQWSWCQGPDPDTSKLPRTKPALIRSSDRLRHV